MVRIFLFSTQNTQNDLSLYTSDPDAQMQTRTLLRDMIYDALHVFTYAVQNISQSFTLPSPRVTCDFSKYGNFQPWEAGISLIKLMRSVRNGFWNGEKFSQRVTFPLDFRR